ncbi:MAG: ABC transporter substrate-binding protein [Rhodovulum sulfidophilum]|uniref:ABC transporter substrate-binding protein n=1 Tax=Rhodovulum sulfidophilum TaxID=35806 RepID=A0A2W5N4P9_RHOSU|nr:MAG: ABC transporter substrate-binding protein [Rhodovulum sulfidophilum]
MTTEIPVDNPLLSHLGIRLVEWRTGHAEFHLAINAHHLNRQGNLQGGVVATLLDVACGYAGLSPPDSGRRDDSATVMLNVSFLDKANSGVLIARGCVSRSGKRLYFATGEVTTDEGRIIATAQGTFRIFREADRDQAPGAARG